MDSLMLRPDGDPHAKALKKYDLRYHDFKEGKKFRKVANQTHVSKTDPDASLVSRKSHYRKLCYKTHYSIDAHSRMITDCHMTTGPRHECTVFPERVSYQLTRYCLPANEWIADKGYGSGPTYHYLSQHHIRAYIPLHDDKLGAGKLSRGKFIYERHHDSYRCPEGHYLYKKIKGRSTKRYRMTGKHCKACPIRNACLPDNYTHRARYIYRSFHQDEIDKIKRRQKTPYFRKKLTELNIEVYQRCRSNVTL